MKYIRRFLVLYRINKLKNEAIQKKDYALAMNLVDRYRRLTKQPYMGMRNFYHHNTQRLNLLAE